MALPNIKKPKKNNTPLIIIAALLGGALIAFGVYLYLKPSAQAPNRNDQNINYGPPTEEELKETEAKKDEIVAGATKEDENAPSLPTPQPTPTPNGKKSVTPTITYAGQVESSRAVEATGFISQIFEDGGTCTLTLTKGSLKITKQTDGFKDVNRTSCTQFTINRGEFLEAGEWTAVLAYDSPTAAGASESWKVGVQ